MVRFQFAPEQQDLRDSVAQFGRFYRDAKVLEIGEGTSEVQRMLIARELGHA